MLHVREAQGLHSTQHSLSGRQLLNGALSVRAQDTAP